MTLDQATSLAIFALCFVGVITTLFAIFRKDIP
jgi:hypothetical protein